MLEMNELYGNLYSVYELSLTLVTYLYSKTFGAALMILASRVPARCYRAWLGFFFLSVWPPRLRSLYSAVSSSHARVAQHGVLHADIGKLS
jgi:hypothetical protein